MKKIILFLLVGISWSHLEASSDDDNSTDTQSPVQQNQLVPIHGVNLDQNMIRTFQTQFSNLDLSELSPAQMRALIRMSDPRTMLQPWNSHAGQMVELLLNSKDFSLDKSNNIHCYNSKLAGSLTFSQVAQLFNECTKQDKNQQDIYKQKIQQAVNILRYTKVNKKDLLSLYIGAELPQELEESWWDKNAAVALASSPELLRTLFIGWQKDQVLQFLVQIAKTYIKEGKGLWTIFEPRCINLFCQIVVALCCVEDEEDDVPHITLREIMDAFCTVDKKIKFQARNKDKFISFQFQEKKQAQLNEVLANFLYHAQRDVILYKLIKSENVENFADVLGEVIQIMNDGLEASGFHPLTQEESLHAVIDQLFIWLDCNSWDPETGYYQMPPLVELNRTLRKRYFGVTMTGFLFQVLNFFSGLYAQLTQGNSLMESEKFREEFKKFVEYDDKDEQDQQKASPFQRMKSLIELQKEELSLKQFAQPIAAIQNHTDTKSKTSDQMLLDRIINISCHVFTSLNEIANHTGTNEQLDYLEYLNTVHQIMLFPIERFPFIAPVIETALNKTIWAIIGNTIQLTINGGTDNILVGFQNALQVFQKFQDLDPAIVANIVRMLCTKQDYIDYQRAYRRMLLDFHIRSCTLDCTKFRDNPDDLHKLPESLKTLFKDLELLNDDNNPNKNGIDLYCSELLWLLLGAIPEINSVGSGTGISQDGACSNLESPIVFYRYPSVLFDLLIMSFDTLHQKFKKSRVTNNHWDAEIFDLFISGGGGYLACIVYNMLKSLTSEGQFSLSWKTKNTDGTPITHTYGTPITQCLDRALEFVHQQDLKEFLKNSDQSQTQTLIDPNVLQNIKNSQIERYSKEKNMFEFSIKFAMFINHVLNDLTCPESLRNYLNMIDIKNGIANLFSVMTQGFSLDPNDDYATQKFLFYNLRSPNLQNPEFVVQFQPSIRPALTNQSRTQQQNAITYNNNDDDDEP